MKIDKDIFINNLSITKVFCNNRQNTANVATTLRSFNPTFQKKPLFQFRESEHEYYGKKDLFAITDWFIDPFEKGQEGLINELFELQLKHKNQSSGLEISGTVIKGEIIFSEIDNTVIDGASAAVSLGLFDDYDLPPIDTWFYMCQSDKGLLLFGWIPEQFQEYANDAIAVNCVDCIHWFKDSYPSEFLSLNCK